VIQASTTLWKPLIWGLLMAWALLQWTVARPPAAAADWMGWRQADTQAIALNFRDSGNNILRPQIDWRGAGPGFVETELQLYTWLIKFLLPSHGNTEWPGQLISLLSMTLAIAVTFFTLARHYSPPIAIIATSMAMTSLGSMHLATSIQPDALCFLLYVCGLASFHRFLQDDEQRWFWIATLCSIVAVLVKPTALHLGIIQFVALVLGNRQRLRSPLPWLGWLAILACFGIYACIAHRNYIDYGNTFGIGFGGDAKWPAIRELLNPLSYYTLLRQSMMWGLGVAGAVSAALLLVRRKLTAWEWALIAGNAAHLVVSMRYSSAMWLGSHYHIFSLFTGCWLFAHALQEFLPAAARIRQAIVCVLVALLLWQGSSALHHRIHHESIGDGDRFLSVAALARHYIKPGDQIVVRSTATARIDGTRNGGINNFEDPRLFYLTSSKGWILAVDDDDTNDMEKAVRGGAAIYIHLGDFSELPATQEWLTNHAQRLDENQFGAIYALPDEDQIRSK